MTVSINPVIDFTAVEVIDPDAARETSIAHNGFNLADLALNGSSTPAVSKVSYVTHELSSGALTIDLTALESTNGATITANGLKAQTVIIANPDSNANDITITTGASNGYEIFGASDGKITLSPGDWAAFKYHDTRDDVDSTHKTIDVSGTGSQAIQIGFTFG